MIVTGEIIIAVVLTLTRSVNIELVPVKLVLDPPAETMDVNID